MRTETERAAPTGKPADAAPCEEMVVPGPITVKPRSLGRTVVDVLGDALGRLDEGLNGRAHKPPLPDSYWKARREWYQQEICMGGCDHHSPSCLEADRLTDCMKDMPYKLRLEMNEAVPQFRSQREYDEYWADLHHASGENMHFGEEEHDDLAD